MFDYLNAFPIPADLLPARLRQLLEPVGLEPSLRVEVNSFTETDPHGPNSETVHMLMAVVPDSVGLPIIEHSDNGIVAYSVPVLRNQGSEKDFSPQVGGHDYIVASWSNGSFYTFNLAEKVWMALGLTPRCIGNEHQKLVYDDLQLPEFGVAEGEVSGQYYYKASRNIRWYISNDYLRRYLWLRGGRGVRHFYFQSMLPDDARLRAMVGNEGHATFGGAGDWFDGDIRVANGGFSLQVWATVQAVSCELCAEQTAEGVQWPDVLEPVTSRSANAMLGGPSIYLDDRFLERYEQNSFYGTTPVSIYGRWHCSPSYLGQWSFTDCQRVGRNLIKIQLRELYKGKPSREILHARAHAREASEVAQLDLTEEHIVAKVDRLLSQFLDLGENLSRLAASLGIQKSPEDLFGFARAEVSANGWLSYPQLSKLAQVAPLSMSQHSFLSRCKSIHEVWQRLPNGFLKQLLRAAGVPQKRVAELASLKLLQALLNVIERLDVNEEDLDAFKSENEPEGWASRNAGVAMLFLNNDIRIADAHDAMGDSLTKMQDMGFDTATLHEGYGRALDFVLNGVIDGFSAINRPLSRILARS